MARGKYLSLEEARIAGNSPMPMHMTDHHPLRHPRT